MKNITIETTEGTEMKKFSVISVVKNPLGPDRD